MMDYSLIKQQETVLKEDHEDSINQIIRIELLLHILVKLLSVY